MKILYPPRRKLQMLLRENRIFYPYKVKTFISSRRNCAIPELENLIWLISNLPRNSYCVKVKTVLSIYKWGNELTVLFKNPKDAVQYKLIWN